jgi:hypothetical protein
MRVRRSLGAVVSLFLLGATAATAQAPDATAHGPWQVTIFGGGWNAIGTAYLYRTPSGTSEVGFGNAPAFGVSAGLDVSRLTGIELSWMQASPAQQFVGSPPTPIRNVTLNVFELDSLWYFRRGGFQPYAIFGIGGANTGSSFGGANLTVAVGLGAKAYLDRHFAVRADVRWDAMYGNVAHPGDAAFCDSAGCYYYRSSWFSSLVVTGGLTYAF